MKVTHKINKIETYEAIKYDGKDKVLFESEDLTQHIKDGVLYETVKAEFKRYNDKPVKQYSTNKIELAENEYLIKTDKGYQITQVQLIELTDKDLKKIEDINNKIGK